MKAIFFVLFAVALSVNLRNSEFTSYMSKYGKTYAAPEEARYRLRVFNDNLLKIKEHNAKNLPWTLGVNKFADVSAEEFAYKFCGCAKDPKTRGTRQTTLVGDVPARVDWREQGAVTPVKNQGMCGSCWAFSTTGTTEGAYFLKTGNLVSLSEQQLVDCARDPEYENFGCSGGWPWSAVDYVTKHGLCTEEDYPYKGVDAECKESSCKVAVQSVDKVQLPVGDEDSLAVAVSKTPVSIVLDATAMQLYDKGIITRCSESINHAVLAVGYDKDAETGLKYWIIKNSWGADWGEEGYCRIEKDVGGMGRCALTYSSVYPVF
ncbi:uncharacterized protein [Blastocystis hominis]|uniref:Uncharacterized protein n=1 Tax=Blastocystis hominis TaxID=12968 RepID=D8M0W9_BLAHO|nr:uncharacterized protein [Blastocystis hominis]CBK21708.2 unnamed protein product [Blastocystis hominis]|eukprot:XP_012895756.1 uncharacterized protein [Blastocystis hominis]